PDTLGSTIPSQDPACNKHAGICFLTKSEVAHSNQKKALSGRMPAGGPSLSNRTPDPVAIGGLSGHAADTTAACSGLRPAPDCRSRRAFLHFSYSCAPPFGLAMLVTHDPKATCTISETVAHSLNTNWQFKVEN